MATSKFYDISRIIGLLFFSVIGLFLLVSGYDSYKNSSETLKWSKIEGKITENRVEKIKVSSGNGSIRRYSTAYQAILSYSYIVDGKQYVDNSIYYDAIESSLSKNETELFLEDYKLDSIVPVYYNPQDPSDAVLIPQTTGAGPFLMILGVFFCLPAVFVMPGSISKIINN